MDQPTSPKPTEETQVSQEPALVSETEDGQESNNHDDSVGIIDSTNTAADELLTIERIIKAKVRTMGTLKEELKKFREMLESTLMNDETYRNHSEAAKQAAKVKSATKQQILKLPQNANVASKVKELSAELKELDEELSDYLVQYTKVSGSNEIEAVDGEVQEIVYIPKLVRKMEFKPKQNG